MSQALVQFNPAGMPAHLVDIFGDGGNEELTSGAEAAFPVLSIKGKVWRVSHGGEQRVLQREGEPIQSLDVVIAAANKVLSKLYYAKAYQEGDDNPPDCSSANGITPDAGVQAPQSVTCATCRHNVWGSKITEQGKKGKACGDTRRVALIPERDMECQTWGAPLLLRIPPGTFQALTEYARTQLQGRQYYAVLTRIGFDMMVAYPKITFKPLRYVTEAEARVIANWRSDPIVARIIGTDVDPSAPNAQVTVPASQPVVLAASSTGVVPPGSAVRAPASTAAPDPFAPTSAAPANLPSTSVAPPPAPAVVQPPVDPLAGIPEAMRPAVMAAGGPESAAGQIVMKALLAAQPVAQPAKRTRRSKAEMDAVRAVTPAAQGHVLPNTGAGQVSELAARPPTPVTSSVVAPTGQDDLLAGVDALLAGLQFDD